MCPVEAGEKSPGIDAERLVPVSPLLNYKCGQFQASNHLPVSRKVTVSKAPCPGRISLRRVEAKCNYQIIRIVFLDDIKCTTQRFYILLMRRLLRKRKVMIETDTITLALLLFKSGEIGICK